MTNDQTVTQALKPCPLCQSSEVEFGGYGRGVYCIICKDCCIQTKFYPSRDAAATAWNTRTAHSGEGRENDKPPSHWVANDKCNRHPQSAEEWDWHADSPSEDSCERSIKRLNFAVDRGDPDAPNQMALVLRVDLSRVLGRLVHYTAHRELLMQKLDGEGRSNGAGEDDLIEALRQQAESESKASRILADSKSQRQADNPERSPVYLWVKPEETISWKAADRLAALTPSALSGDAGETERLRTALERIVEVGTRRSVERIGDMYDTENGYQDIETVSEEAEIAAVALAALSAPQGEVERLREALVEHFPTGIRGLYEQSAQRIPVQTHVGTNCLCGWCTSATDDQEVREEWAAHVAAALAQPEAGGER